MEHFDTWQLIALAAALGWASGIRLYAVLFITGAVGFAGWYELPEHLRILSHPMVLAASGFMVVAEFFADKVPGFDSVWDLVHTFVRIPAGAALAASVFGDSPPAWTLTAAILGGTLAAGSHFTKSGARMVINTSPEPFSNWAASFGEDMLVGVLLYLALAYPIAFFVVLALLVALTIWMLPKLVRSLRAMVERIQRWFGAAPGRPGRTADDRSPDVHQDPDRQPRRDRLPRRAHRAAHGRAHRGRLFRRRRRARCMSRPATRRIGSGRRRRARATSPATRSSRSPDRPARRRFIRATAFSPRTREFAAAVAAAGLVFIGPPPAAIRAMGSKSESKTIMGRAGVALVPGYHGDDQDDALLRREADAIGYPVLIKASAGGGGKGMRVVERSRGFRRGARLGAARGASRASATSGAARKISARAAAHRNAGVRRYARRVHPPVRARLLGAAAPSESASRRRRRPG